MISPKLAAARVRLVEEQPYLGAAVWKVSIQEISSWPSSRGEIAVTERGVILCASGLVARATVDQLAAALSHEIMHVLMGHAPRRNGREPGPWNHACDFAINPDVRNAWPGGFPYQVLYPANYGLPDGLTAEAYYEKVEKDEDQTCGSGAGHAHPAEALAPPVQDAPDEVEWEAARAVVASAVRAHKGMGSVPAGLDRWATETFEPTPVDWRRALAGAVRGELAAAGAHDYTYARPSRRGVAGVVLPSMRAPKLRAAVVIDTSGSRGEEDFAGDLADVKGILRASGAGSVHVVACDAEVHASVRAKNTADAGRTLKGGGGSDMAPGIAVAARGQRQGERPDVIVVLTDGWVSWGDPPPRGVRVVAVVPEGGEREVPPWARKVTK